MTCRVRGCRFASSHVSSYHRCGTCGATGHGQIECGKPREVALLRPHMRDVFDGEPCRVRGCALNQTHCTSAHHCDACGRFGGGACGDCAPDGVLLALACPVCRRTQTFERVYVTGSCPVCLGTDLDDLYLGTQCKHALCGCCGAAMKERRDGTGSR